MFKIGEEYNIGNDEIFKVIERCQDEPKGIYYKVEGLECTYYTEELLNTALKYNIGIHEANNILNERDMENFNNRGEK